MPMVVRSHGQELTQLFALARAFHRKIPHNQAIGNPLQPTPHGGVVGALLETTAWLQILAG